VETKRELELNLKDIKIFINKLLHGKEIFNFNSFELLNNYSLVDASAYIQQHFIPT